MQNKKFLMLFGYVFLIWAIFDLILKVNIYGFRELDFIWFCSITLFILAFGLALKNEVLLNSFLSMALLVQIVFVLDYMWLSFFNVKLNGTSLYVFQPGFGLLEFISTTKHMLMIPFAFYGVFLLSHKNTKSYFFITGFVISLLVFSYIFSPKYQNLNCVFRPCFKYFGGGLTGFSYFIFFLISMIILSLFINFILNSVLKKFQKLRDKKIYKKSIFFIFIILLAISLASIAAASFRYSKIPKYSCRDSNECINCTVNVKCKYVDTIGKNLFLVYTIKNNDNQNYACNVYLKINPNNTEYKKIGENYSIRSKKSYKIWQKISYPEVDSEIKLRLDCEVIS